MAGYPLTGYDVLSQRRVGLMKEPSRAGGAIAEGVEAETK